MTDGPPRPSDRGQALADGKAWERFGRRAVAAFPGHLRGFIVLNVVLTIVNAAVTGRPWWAVWPLIGSGFALAVHYFVCKAATADEGWASARVEELNLKSYDRSHIEDIRERVDKDGYGRPRE